MIHFLDASLCQHLEIGCRLGRASMRRSLYIGPMLSLLLMTLLGGGLAGAESARSMAELQESLNAEILSKPFSVAERPARDPAAEEQQAPQATPYRSKGYDRPRVYSRLHLGWHYGRPFHHQYCGQNLGRLFGNNTIVAKGFVLRAGFFQTQPVS